MAMASIDDLLKKKPPAGGKPAADDASPQAKLEKRMKQIKLQQVENDTKARASEAGFDHINLVGFPISPEALTLIPRVQAQKEKVIAFLFNGTEVRIGAVEPRAPAVSEVAFQVQERSHANAKVYMISQNSFEAAEKMYDALPEVKELVKGVEITEEELKRFQALCKTFKELDEHVQKTTATDF